VKVLDEEIGWHERSLVGKAPDHLFSPIDGRTGLLPQPKAIGQK